MTQRHEIAWTGEDGTRRRLIFERRVGDGWTRIEQRHVGGEWLQVGREIVADLDFASPRIA